MGTCEKLQYMMSMQQRNFPIALLELLAQEAACRCRSRFHEILVGKQLLKREIPCSDVHRFQRTPLNVIVFFFSWNSHFGRMWTFSRDSRDSPDLRGFFLTLPFNISRLAWCRTTLPARTSSSHIFGAVTKYFKKFVSCFVPPTIYGQNHKILYFFGSRFELTSWNHLSRPSDFNSRAACVELSSMTSLRRRTPLEP